MPLTEYRSFVHGHFRGVEYLLFPLKGKNENKTKSTHESIHILRTFSRRAAAGPQGAPPGGAPSSTCSRGSGPRRDPWESGLSARTLRGRLRPYRSCGTHIHTRGASMDARRFEFLPSRWVRGRAARRRGGRGGGRLVLDGSTGYVMSESFFECFFSYRLQVSVFNKWKLFLRAK